MYRHWQTAPTGVLDGQEDSLCHTPLPGGGTQLAPCQELAGPEGSIAAAGGARIPPRLCVRVDHCGQDRTSVRLTLLHLISIWRRNSLVILIGSDNTTTGHTSARWNDRQTLRDEATLRRGKAPCRPSSRVLRLGVHDKLAVAGVTRLPGLYRVNPVLG